MTPLDIKTDGLLGERNVKGHVELLPSHLIVCSFGTLNITSICVKNVQLLLELHVHSNTLSKMG